MTILLNIVFISGGYIELVSIVVCTVLLGIKLKNQINKRGVILSFIAYIIISALTLIARRYFDKSMNFIVMILYFMRFITAIYFLFKHISGKIIYLIFYCDLSISLVGSSISSILVNIIGQSLRDVSPYAKFFVQFVVFIIFISVGKKQSAKRNMTAFTMIPHHIFIMLILTIICFSALSSLINFPTDNRIMKRNILTAIVIILTIDFIYIIASLILNVIAKQHFTALSQMMEKQVELQISHYNEVEKMNYEINRFRHDYSNHLQSILSLVQMGECSMAEEYILKLKKVKFEPAATIFYTGNRLADAILTNKSSLLDEGSRIEYSGIMPLSIENVDLCVILSNSLDNAIEACRELQKPCMISVFAKEQQGYFVLSIKNPTACSDNYYDIPPTSKADKEQHGMGLYNIESVVKKYDGQMKIKCEDGFFELVITMKI